MIKIKIHTQHAHRRPDVLNRSTIPQGQQPVQNSKMVYRKLYDVEPTSQLREHGYYASKGKPTYTTKVKWQGRYITV